jgi:hypothetical protein
MRRRVGTILVLAATAAVAAFATVGHASSVGVTTKTLGAGSSAVARCDTDGVSVVQNLTGANVTGVTVSGIAAACATGTLSVAVNNGTTSSTGTAVVPAGGGSMTLALAAGVAMKDSDEVDVSVSGP